jgi:hypothetical protein
VKKAREILGLIFLRGREYFTEEICGMTGNVFIIQVTAYEGIGMSME